MLNKVITIDQVMSWEPCYDRKKILRLSRGKTELTVGAIIDLRFVPVVDKFWLLLREEIIPARTLHEFAIWCAETALTKANVTDERSWNALKVKRLWLDGKTTDKELNAAWAAARYAAWDAAWDAARVATMDAAMDAARVATRVAARVVTMNAARYAARAATMDAAWGAARAATMDAVMDAAWDTQLAKLKEMLEGQAYVKQGNRH